MLEQHNQLLHWSKQRIDTNINLKHILLAACIDMHNILNHNQTHPNKSISFQYLFSSSSFAFVEDESCSPLPHSQTFLLFIPFIIQWSALMRHHHSSHPFYHLIISCCVVFWMAQKKKNVHKPWLMLMIACTAKQCIFIPSIQIIYFCGSCCCCCCCWLPLLAVWIN